MSTEEFKHRIAIIRRKIETGKTYSVIGASRPHHSLVRKLKPNLKFNPGRRNNNDDIRP
jgi:hypothetical protein